MTSYGALVWRSGRSGRSAAASGQTSSYRLNAVRHSPSASSPPRSRSGEPNISSQVAPVSRADLMSAASWAARGSTRPRGLVATTPCAVAHFWAPCLLVPSAEPTWSQWVPARRRHRAFRVAQGQNGQARRLGHVEAIGEPGCRQHNEAVPLLVAQPEHCRSCDGRLLEPIDEGVAGYLGSVAVEDPATVQAVHERVVRQQWHELELERGLHDVEPQQEESDRRVDLRIKGRHQSDAVETVSSHRVSVRTSRDGRGRSAPTPTTTTVQWELDRQPLQYAEQTHRRRGDDPGPRFEDRRSAVALTSAPPRRPRAPWASGVAKREEPS